MPRKRRYDLREFWPWYERQWAYRTTRPPFSLRDISEKVPVTPAERRTARLVFVLLTSVAIGVVVWGLFLL